MNFESAPLASFESPEYTGLTHRLDVFGWQLPEILCPELISCQQRRNFVDGLEVLLANLLAIFLGSCCHEPFLAFCGSQKPSMLAHARAKPDRAHKADIFAGAGNRPVVIDAVHEVHEAGRADADIKDQPTARGFR
jgi:hypothetical protein